MHYVIGDVHGCIRELKQLVQKIENQDPDAIFVFVGDWIDRGENTADVMQWVVDNITLNGKYRSVRGNHDQEALEWYNEQFLPWAKQTSMAQGKPPETYYDFSEVVEKDFDCDPKALKPFFKKVMTAMPFRRRIEIISAAGVPVTYYIVHAWYSPKHLSIKNSNYVNLYERNYNGYHSGKDIIVHGHTPTISRDYRLRGFPDQELPGMVGYRTNAINVDGGCCFHRSYPELACMLCAICLETLEEFYPCSLEERMMEGAKYIADYWKENRENINYEEVIQINFELNMERYESKKPNRFRQAMLGQLGLN